MSLLRIDDIQLYMGITADAAECFAAKQFLVTNNIEYLTYMYADDGQHPQLFESLSSWKLPGAPTTLTKFPFVIYTEIHIEMAPSEYPRAMLYGIDAILASDIVEKYAVGR